MRARLSPRGLAAGAAAFSIWGLFPIYLHPLRDVPALQVICHRIAWSCLFILGWMLLRVELGRLADIFARPALLARLLPGPLLERMAATCTMFRGNGSPVWKDFLWRGIGACG